MPIPGDPGYYAQDNAPYLRYYDGAAYDPFFSANAVQTVGANASTVRRAVAVVTNPLSACYGYHFVVSRDGVGNPIEVYSGLYGTTNVTTIDVNAEFPTADASSIVSLCYDANKDNVYFTWTDAGAATARVSVIDCSVTPPVINTDIYGSGETYLESETNADYPTAGTYLFLGGNCDMIYNPVNDKKYILTLTGRYYIINTNDKFEIVALGQKAACVLAVAASPESDGMCIVTASPPAAPFDARMVCLYGNNMDQTYTLGSHKVDPNGDVWVVTQNIAATTNSLICIDGTKGLADGATLIKYAIDVPGPTPGVLTIIAVRSPVPITMVPAAPRPPPPAMVTFGSSVPTYPLPALVIVNPATPTAAQVMVIGRHVGDGVKVTVQGIRPVVDVTSSQHACTYPLYSTATHESVSTRSLKLIEHGFPPPVQGGVASIGPV